MTKTTAYLTLGLAALMVTAYTVLAALQRDTAQLTQFMLTVIIPLVTMLVAVNKADKAKTAAETAAHNTNGRMSELIRLLREQGKEVPSGYDDVAVSPVHGQDSTQIDDGGNSNA